MWREAWEWDDEVQTGGTVHYGPLGLPIFSGTVLSKHVGPGEDDAWYEVQPGLFSI